MNSAELTSLLSAGVAVVAAVVAFSSYVQQRRSSQLSFNLLFLSDSMKQLAARPSLLTLHNIDVKALAEDGIAVEEFLYILNTIYAGQTYHALGSRRSVKLSEYRRNLLGNPKFKIVWQKHIRDNMTGKTPYTDAIDEFYARE